MLRIRLARRGKKRQPSYRVVVAESSSKRDGRFVEQIGYYNPMVDPIVYKVDEGRALHWLSVGAQPSDAVARLLKKQGTYDRLTRLRAGEELGKLVAEFEGTEWPPVEDVADDAADAVEEAADNAAERISDGESGLRDRAADVVESAGDVVSGAVETVGDAASGAVETVTGLAASAAEAASNLAGSLADAISGDDDEADSDDSADSEQA